jgi:hypothetical protein
MTAGLRLAKPSMQPEQAPSMKTINYGLIINRRQEIETRQ